MQVTCPTILIQWIIFHLEPRPQPRPYKGSTHFFRLVLVERMPRVYFLTRSLQRETKKVVWLPIAYAPSKLGQIIRFCLMSSSDAKEICLTLSSSKSYWYLGCRHLFWHFQKCHFGKCKTQKCRNKNFLQKCRMISIFISENIWKWHFWKCQNQKCRSICPLSWAWLQAKPAELGHCT